MIKLHKTLLALSLASVVAGTAPALAETPLSLTVSDFVLVTDPAIIRPCRPRTCVRGEMSC
ncbi:MAG: hypothetical protein KDJ31_01570 [Candidatus Competibacteraceae bacterium]|nr:hypothetical protein [Candidatus Competibacteraceae bacterium]HRY16488.1 hypothetical protein [Candidatus Competibacteraceae bacterium]